MNRSSLPSFQPPNEPGYRRLRRGKSSAGRPLRAQVVVASMVGLVVVAVPLYLLRRPRQVPTSAAPEQATRHAFGGVITPPRDAGPPESAIEVGSAQRVKCSASPKSRGNEGGLCDRLPLLEAALRRGIQQSEDCAPKTGKEGTINYVLEVDFSRGRLNVFAGQSGQWKGPQARRAARCVLRSFPPIPWEKLQHDYRFYQIAMMATYPAPDPLEILPRFD